jgi:hypothetical protein
MSTVKSKKLQVGTDATASNNFTIYQPSTPDGTLRIGQGNADSPTEVGQFNANGYKPQTPVVMQATSASDFTVANVTTTKIPFDTAGIDTASGYDTTNKRWTPGVSGYYKFHATVHAAVSGLTGHVLVLFYKNGSAEKQQYTVFRGSEGNNGNSGVTAILQLDDDDYVEAYMYHNLGSTRTVYSSSLYTYWEGHLISQA